MTLELILKKNPDAAYRIYDGEATIVLPSRASVHVLNPIGSFIWDSLDGTATLGQILDRVVEEYEIGRDAAEGDLMEFIGALSAQGMVT